MIGFFKRLFFKFGEIASVIFHQFALTTDNMDVSEKIDFTLISKSRFSEVLNFLQKTYGIDNIDKIALELSEICKMHREINNDWIIRGSEGYYMKNVVDYFGDRPISMNRDVLIETYNSKSFTLFFYRINLVTAAFDYVKQFCDDDGIDSKFFLILYKELLKKADLKPLSKY